MAKSLEERLSDGSTQARTPTPPSLPDQIRKMEDQFERAMPRGYDAGQLVRDALTAVRNTPKLANADRMSVLGAFMTCAQLGLRPNVLGQAYVVPYWDRMSSGFRAQLQIGYQGYIELAYRTGKIATFNAQTVYENDEFGIRYGTESGIHHAPFLAGDRGRPVAYYAVAKMTSGDFAFHHMSLYEAEQYRDEHASARNRRGEIVGPWKEHFDAMAKKSCVVQLAKFLPKTTDLAFGLQVDNGVREDVHPEAIGDVSFPRPSVEAAKPEPGTVNVPDAEPATAPNTDPRGGEGS